MQYSKLAHIALQSKGSRTGSKATRCRQRLGDFGMIAGSLVPLLLEFRILACSVLNRYNRDEHDLSSLSN